MSAPLIVLEFNELVPRLMDAYLEESMLPGFGRLRDESLACVTDAGESPPWLEPWIQWVTVHTGLAASEHGVFDLNDGSRCKSPRIWDLMLAADKKVWVCGSMNAAVEEGRPLQGLMLPDPWASGVEASPKKFFEPYTHFVSTYVRDHSKERPPLSWIDYLKFGKFMVANGLSTKTVTSTIRQLASERRLDSKWKRATILDRLQWDMFRANYLRLRPDFSTFFLNSTAHFQHYHWREMEPDSFDLQPSRDQRRDYQNAIRTGYIEMDNIVSECLRMAPEATIVLCTALSQQPLVLYDQQGGKQVFRAHSARGLVQYAGIDSSFECQPLMAEEFQLRFGSEPAAALAYEKLTALVLNDGQSLLRVRRNGCTLVVGCAIFSSPSAGARIMKPGTSAGRPFAELFYPLEGVKSGTHHPDGIFWVRRPGQAHSQLDRKLALTEVAPILLTLAGLDPCLISEVPPPPEVLTTVASREMVAA